MQNKSVQQTLVLIKPDALLYSLTGFIIERISAVLNPVIAASKVVKVTRELAEAHYKNIKDKPFFETTIDYIMGELHYPDQPEKRRVMAIVYEGPQIVEGIKKYFGPTKPRDCKRLAKEKGIITLRSQLSYTDFSVNQEELIDNAVHASEDIKEAEREIKLWFEPGDFPAQHRLFPYVESDEHFYFLNDLSAANGFKIVSSYQKGEKCIIAPGCLVWKTDYMVICAYRDGKADMSQSINHTIAKYTLKTI
ncbi:nucleoside-diphosphate kinase [bacterium]|nr:nucleoside-diphosphate kinase [bacterium]